MQRNIGFLHAPLQVVGVDLTTCKGGIRYVKIGLDRLLHVILLHVYNHVYSKRHILPVAYICLYICTASVTTVLKRNTN